LREGILAHAGEANAERLAFERLNEYGRDSIIEFLKSLQVLPPARGRSSSMNAGSRGTETSVALQGTSARVQKDIWLIMAIASGHLLRRDVLMGRGRSTAGGMFA
jgi:hypothetical protein